MNVAVCCALCSKPKDLEVRNAVVLYLQWSKSRYFSDVGALCETCMGHLIIHGPHLKINDQVISILGPSGKTKIHDFWSTKWSVIYERIQGYYNES